MSLKDLLLEIGTEEIPAAFIEGALDYLKSQLEKDLITNRIIFKDVQSVGTPRRLVLIAYGLSTVQQDLTVIKTGPPKSRAFDNDGNPTQAASGFAKAHGVDVSELKTVKTEKGEYICCQKQEKGKLVIKLLPGILSRIILSIPFPKSMRWDNMNLRFARPIHWILALFDGEKVNFKLENISSGNLTFGHRFMSPQPIRVTGVSSYLKATAEAFVMVDHKKRREEILKGIRNLALSAGGIPDEDESLLKEVTFLIEYPFPVLCAFDKEFLDLPQEVLTMTMKVHQKYFPVMDKKRRLLPHFIAVNNNVVKNPQVVVSGHERVLHARLSDARFFYREDQKKTLDKMTEDLKSVIFQSQLGTSFDKVKRFQSLALYLSDTFIDPTIRAKVERAAFLCKADLMSEMVGEFPELQGVMGREYALLAGEDREVAQAIFEHYLPRFAEDAIPKTHVGAVISIADKLDTIVGCFGIGLAPSGTSDPYALRRQCLGIINIILSKQYMISLKGAITKSLSLLSDNLSRPPEEVYSEVLEFFSARLANLLTSREYQLDVVEAVLCLGMDNILDMVKRIDALQHIKKEPDFEPLATAFKRVVHILAGDTPQSCSVNPELFEKDQERELYAQCLKLQDQVKILMERKNYIHALKLIATLRKNVDAFFDTVMVMADNESVRKNRLALLCSVSSLFTNFADFSRLSNKK